MKPAAETPKVEEVKEEDTTPKVSLYLHNGKHTVVNVILLLTCYPSLT